MSDLTKVLKAILCAETPLTAEQGIKNGVGTVSKIREVAGSQRLVA